MDKNKKTEEKEIEKEQCFFDQPVVCSNCHAFNKVGDKYCRCCGHSLKQNKSND